MEENKNGRWKALRIVSVILLVFAVLIFLFVAFTFLVSFVIGGQIITDGTGLMRFFLKATSFGQRPIAAAKFGMAGMPALGAATCFLVYCCVLVTWLRKRNKNGPAFRGARGGLIAMWVLTGLAIVIQPVLWLVCRNAVAGSGFFTLVFQFPYLGVLMLILTLLLMKDAGKPQEIAAPEPVQTE